MKKALLFALTSLLVKADYATLDETEENPRRDEHLLGSLENNPYPDLSDNPDFKHKKYMSPEDALLHEDLDDEFQDYEWEDDMGISSGDDDAWDDDAVMDEGEDEGMDGCPFGEMRNEETGECESIDYSGSDFNYGEGFTDDEFIEDELNDSDRSLSEI